MEDKGVGCVTKEVPGSPCSSHIIQDETGTLTEAAYEEYSIQGQRENTEQNLVP